MSEASAPAVVPGSVAVGYLDPGTWSACFGLSYRDLLLCDMAGSGRIVRPDGVELRMVAGTGGIPAGRNEVAARFLRSNAEWLFMVDSDMGFAPDTVDRLVDAADPVDRPVLGGLCFALKHATTASHYGTRANVQPTLFRYLELDDGEVGFTPIMDYPRDQVIEVAGTGAACVLIHRSALVAVAERYGHAWFDPITHPTGDKGKPRTFSEDLSFCVRLAAVDVPLHAHTGVKTTHHKGPLFLDEELYDASRPSAPPADPETS